MAAESLVAPNRAAMTAHVLAALGDYWAREPQRIAALPVADRGFPDIAGPLRLEAVRLPKWAAECGVSSSMLVPHEACRGDRDWRTVDWFLAVFLLLECWHERARENANGPIHSYSFKLKGWDDRAWRHAWVNRIALFLRQWASVLAGRDADRVLGLCPGAKITVTHDVDAVTKTLAVRVKQGAFCAFNALRQSAGGHWTAAGADLKKALRFVLSRDDWWKFDDLLAIEERNGIRSRFHFYADRRRKSLKRWLFDPGYDIRDRRVRELLGQLASGGWHAGLHPSFDAWRSASLIGDQKRCLDSVSPAPARFCRQHWLRFSWKDTWRAQEAAGLEEDATLMFNDRMGFRAAAAVCWSPWNPVTGRAHGMRALPTVMMDSHSYDYRPMTDQARQKEIRHWLAEVARVGGHCAILWHPHTLAADYGWKGGFLDCIGIADELELRLNG